MGSSTCCTHDDRLAWRRGPYGPEQDREAADPSRRPSGPRDLYTWQSRRMRLHHDGSAVTGVVLCYGDPLPAHDRRFVEPLTGWRRSRPQEKRLGRVPVYLPRQHDPARSAWRGLPALLRSRTGEAAGRAGEPPQSQSPLVLEWVARLTGERVLESRRLIRARTVGAVYGTQQSVIDEVVDDGVTLAVVLLHEDDTRYGQKAVSAVESSDEGVQALVRLAADLAEAAGAEADRPKAVAAERGGSGRCCGRRCGYSADTEQGFGFATHEHRWHPVDHEGLTLIHRPADRPVPAPRVGPAPDGTAGGWSKASRRRRFGGR
ncbi:type I-E CRISPR-associated protein Cse1/CasA [Kitasatospora sp. NPDC004723]|uniref:type I-E CRISPR-associated protein Cse1/CasA n=1 Tax=Kitasatospora sp. NPDC004723 TaxID=3154288 RepID=UPI0033B4ECC9